MTALVTAAVAAMGAAAAQASAASIAVEQACVVNGDPAAGAPMTVTGMGFTPGDTIELTTTTGAASGTVTADSSGGISTQMTGPVLSKKGPRTAAFTLTARDEENALPATPTTIFHVANLAVSTRPMEAKASKRVIWSFSGFKRGAEIYAHYLHGKKPVATIKFGRASGPCGILKAKKAFFPGRARYDSYKVQVDDARRYSVKAVPRFVATLRTHIPM